MYQYVFDILVSSEVKCVLSYLSNFFVDFFTVLCSYMFLYKTFSWRLYYWRIFITFLSQKKRLLIGIRTSDLQLSERACYQLPYSIRFRLSRVCPDSAAVQALSLAQEDTTDSWQGITSLSQTVPGHPAKCRRLRRKSALWTTTSVSDLLVLICFRPSYVILCCNLNWQM